MNSLIINNIGKLFNPKENSFGKIDIIENCSVIIKNGKIDEIVGNEIEINAIRLENYEVIDAEGMSVIPGFVDSHAHPIFAALRDKEFEMMNAGMSYIDIAKAGGGIKNSVKKLRAMTENELYKVSLGRMKEFLKFGTTTLEAKSGYGLTLNDEIKMLKVIKRLNETLEIDLIPTFLGAHDIPDEFKDDREGYISLLINEMIPKIAEEKLAVACDIFIEKNYFTVEEGRRILTAAKEHGLEVKIHADQLTCNGGSELAAELSALSSDHLEYISDKAIDDMIGKNVVFNLMPGASFFIGMPDYPPARKIIEKGGIIALSTDFNPGTCYCYSLPFIMTISAIYLHITAEELLWAATLGGAKALGLEKYIGSLGKGKKADLLIMDIKELSEIPYSMGMNLVRKVIKNGKIAECLCSAEK
ncbi:MAG: imidazolonepropionase [Candidatus Delongbacteria bacterium]|nr:imidazolonepropionase [Candidatus Delongbacteria bacterium]MCG2761072.1 imidazolonepropionase [Candidatus Delongbacteria bacterium]